MCVGGPCILLARVRDVARRDGTHGHLVLLGAYPEMLENGMFSCSVPGADSVPSASKHRKRSKTGSTKQSRLSVSPEIHSVVLNWLP